MPKKVTFEGKDFEFPDDATDDEIFETVESYDRQQKAAAPAPAAPGLLSQAGSTVASGLEKLGGFLIGEPESPTVLDRIRGGF